MAARREVTVKNTIVLRVIIDDGRDDDEGNADGEEVNSPECDLSLIICFPLIISC